MKIKVVDYLVEYLKKLGITEVFGLPGDYNFKIVEAIEKNNNINWIGSTNELNGGYAADGYARTKGYGALVTTFGVGELSAINAIAGCASENVPVIKIVGVPSTHHIENKTLLHHNLDNANYYAFYRAFGQIVETSAFLTKENAKNEIDRIINVMVKTKKPVYLALPIDVCDIEIEDNFIFDEIESDIKNLNIVTDEIVNLIKKSKNPVVIADILAKRFNAKENLNKFLEKTNIPSTAFLRGMDIIQPDIKNYMGVYSGSKFNLDCYKYVCDSDCIVLFGSVISDLNTMNFDFKFDIKNTINVQPYYTTIKGVRYDNILINDVLNLLCEKLDYKHQISYTNTFYYEKTEIKEIEQLSAKYIYPRINEFLRENDILITEVGLIPMGSIPLKLPKNVDVYNQMLWGSIGWATPCAFGSSIAERTRRTILITGDGAHQLTAQEISTMMRNDVKPIIFVINNNGYTIERILCDNVEDNYNNIARWNYSKLPEVFEGDCFVAQAVTNVDLDKVLKQIEYEDRMCYIELFVDYLDIPEIAYASAKHPEQLKKDCCLV